MSLHLPPSPGTLASCRREGRFFIHSPAGCRRSQFRRQRIRGMRIRVTDVLDLLEAGHTPVQVIDELPGLELDDVRASVAYARRRVDHPVLTGT